MKMLGIYVFSVVYFYPLGDLCFSGAVESLCFLFLQNELAAILRFGAEELFKDDKNIEEAKTTLENMDIDQILARAEKVETKTANEVGGNELLNGFKVSSSPLFSYINAPGFNMGLLFTWVLYRSLDCNYYSFF